MKCPECVIEDKKSFVNVGISIRTLMSDDAFYDKEGNYHFHSLNTISTSYYCSNGHKWVEESRDACRSCNFNHEQERTNDTI